MGDRRDKRVSSVLSGLPSRAAKVECGTLCPCTKDRDNQSSEDLCRDFPPHQELPAETHRWRTALDSST